MQTHYSPLALTPSRFTDLLSYFTEEYTKYAQLSDDKRRKHHTL